jgi:precorrin-2/cobalt-factor-2 C20-methyltransferase
MSATFYAVGVGPGDPELITLKALRVLGECHFIGIPTDNPSASHAYRILLQAAPELAHKPILKLPTPMTRDSAILDKSYADNAVLVADTLLQGLSVAAITIGDPSVYAAIHTLLEKIRALGHPTQMIPGVPSFCAAACTLQESLGTRDEAIHILPGSYPVAESLTLTGTKVILKSAGSYPQIRKLLHQNNLQASLVVRCGHPEEKVYPDVKDFPEETEYLSLIIAK